MIYHQFITTILRKRHSAINIYLCVTNSCAVMVTTGIDEIEIMVKRRKTFEIRKRFICILCNEDVVNKKISLNRKRMRQVKKTRT